MEVIATAMLPETGAGGDRFGVEKLSAFEKAAAWFGSAPEEIIC